MRDRQNCGQPLDNHKIRDTTPSSAQPQPSGTPAYAGIHSCTLTLALALTERVAEAACSDAAFLGKLAAEPLNRCLVQSSSYKMALAIAHVQ